MSNSQAIANAGNSYTPPAKPSTLPKSNASVIAAGYGQQLSQPEQTPGSAAPKDQKVLPAGAVAWLPNGEAYYGEGAQGWLNGAQARINDKAYVQNADNTYSEAPITPIALGARYLKEGVGALTEGMQGAQNILQGALSSAPLQTLEDLANKANDVSPSPKYKELARDWVNNIPGVSVVRALYNTARIATGSRKLSWEDVKQTYKGNEVLSSSMLGTSMFDANIRAEFMRRYNAGENPDYLVASMANPWKEMAADIVLDPFMLIGGIAGSIAEIRKVNKVRESFKVLDTVKDDWVALNLAGGTANITTDTPEIVNMATKLLDINLKGVETFASDYNDTAKLLNPMRLTNHGKQIELGDTAGQFFGSVANAFKDNPDAAGEMLRATALIGASDAEKIKEGLQIAYKLNPKMGEMLTSPTGMKTAQFLSKMPEQFIGDLVKSGDVGEMITKYTAKADGVLSDLFPSIHDIGIKQDEIKVLEKSGKDIPAELARFKEYQVPDWARRVADTHQLVQDKFARNTNSFLSSIYITLNPGNAGRNMMNNVFTATIDFGPRAISETAVSFAAKMKNGVNPIDEAIKTKLGALPEASKRGFGGVGALEGGKNPVKIVRDVMEKSEEATRGAVFNLSLEKNLGKDLRVGVGFAPTDNLAAAGIPKEFVDRLINESKRLYGNMGDVKAAILGEGESGVAQVWRNIEINLSKNDILETKGFNGLYDNFHEALQSNSLDDAVKAVDDVLARHKATAAKATEGMLPSYLGDTEMITAHDLGMSPEAADAWTFRKELQRQTTDGFVQAVRETLAERASVETDPALRVLIKNVQAKLEGDLNGILKSDDLNAARTKLVDILDVNKNNPSKMLNQLKQMDKWDQYVGKDVTIDNVRKAAWEQYWFPRYKTEQEVKMWAAVDNGFKHLDSIDPALKESAMITRARNQVDLTSKILDHAIVNDKGIFFDYVDIANKTGQPKDIETAIRFAAGKHKIGTYSATSGAKYDDHILNVINQGLPEGQKITALADVTKENLQSVLDIIGTHRLRTGGQAINIPEGIKNSWEYNKQAQQTVKDIREKIKTLTSTEKSAGMWGSKLQDAENTARGAGISLSAEIKTAGLDRETIKSVLDGVDVSPDKITQSARGATLGVQKQAAEADNLSKVAVPLIDGQLPTSGQAAAENIAGLEALANRFKAGMTANWGRGAAVQSLTPQQLGVLNGWISETTGRVAQVKAVAAKLATMDSDFVLLNYGKKRTIDMALAYIMPYQFWYSRSYKNWMIRLAQHPDILAKYAAYRTNLGKLHAELPEWWRYSVSSNDLPGMQSDNPVFFNLEATLNPLNGISGIDFNDKNKIVGQPGTFEYFWTNTLNDLGKFGPSIWTPLTLGTAAYLYNTGEKDAASRWASRLFPQSAPIKAVAAKFFNKNLEVDPVTWLTSNGTNLDPYETRRVGRALYTLGVTGDNQGKITREQAVEAARSQAGPIWERAKLLATQDRADGTIMSFMLGVGFKKRSSADMEIDNFYSDYNSLWQSAKDRTPQEFKVAMDALRIRYPFMDTVLLSKQGGVDRDRAYAYTVLGRIAPGDSTAIMKAAGLPAGIMDKFYNEKGNIGAWAESDRLKFMGAVVSVGTSLAVPSDSTQQEWTQAKNTYSKMSELIKAQFGADIIGKMDEWYNLENVTQKDLYVKMHPEVAQAMDWKAYYVSSQPILAAYYNGLKNITDYYTGEMKRDVLSSLGADYFDMVAARRDVLDPKELAAYDATSGYKTKLKKYNAIKAKWDAFSERKLLDYGKNLPVGQTSALQAGVTPGAPFLSTGQEAIAQAVQTQSAPAVPQWDTISAGIPQFLQTAIEAYLTNNRPLTTSEKSVLTRTAASLGITTSQLMQSAANTMR